MVQWKGEWYWRKDEQDWRNRRTGEINSVPRPSITNPNFELNYTHPYGGDNFAKKQTKSPVALMQQRLRNKRLANIRKLRRSRQ